MKHFKRIILKKYRIDLNKIKGAGAAGGVGGGLVPILNARIRHGTKEIFRLTGFEHVLKHYDMIITGEGSLDLQSGYGKLVHGIILQAKRVGIPVIGVCGSNLLSNEQSKKIGFNAVFSIVPGPLSLDQALINATHYIRAIGFQLAGFIQAIHTKK